MHDHTRNSKNAREELVDEHPDDPGVESIYSARWSEEFDGKNGLLVTAEIDPDTDEDSLSDPKDGIPVRTTVVPDLRLGCCHHDDYDPVPGGVAVRSSNDVGSAGFCVTDSGDERLLTTNHMRDTCGDNRGKTLDQHADEFGEVDGYDADTDYALVAPTGSQGTDDGVYVDGRTYRVGGCVPEPGVDDLVSSSETCYNTGATTCTTEGTVEGSGLSSPGYHCIDYENDGIKTAWWPATATPATPSSR